MINTLPLLKPLLEKWSHLFNCVIVDIFVKLQQSQICIFGIGLN